MRTGLTGLKIVFAGCHGLAAALAMLIAVAVQAQSGAVMTIRADQPGVLVSSNLFGIFF